MPHLVVAGFKGDQVREIRKQNGGVIRAGWTAEYVLSDDPGPLLGFRKAKPVLRAASRSPESHVLAVSQNGDRRAGLSEQIRHYFRFRWLSNEDLVAAKRDRYAGWVTTLQPILEEEERWAVQVKPASVSDALILPCRGFAYDQLRSDIWSAAESYNAPNAVQNATDLIHRFSLHHKRSVPGEGHHPSRLQWVDEAGVMFDHRGARHGVAPFPRDWKYSHHCGQGFHYDVAHSRKRAFKLAGKLSDRSVAAGGYSNIDCHGYFRDED